MPCLALFSRLFSGSYSYRMRILYIKCADCQQKKHSFIWRARLYSRLNRKHSLTFPPISGYNCITIERVRTPPPGAWISVRSPVLCRVGQAAPKANTRTGARTCLKLRDGFRRLAAESPQSRWRKSTTTSCLMSTTLKADNVPLRVTTWAPQHLTHVGCFARSVTVPD